MADNYDILADLDTRLARKQATLSGEFGKGIASGVDALQGSLYGLAGVVGDVVAEPGLRDWGIAGYLRNQDEAQQNPALVQRVEDVGSLKDAGLYAAQGLGQLVPFAASSIAGGGIGGAAARVAGRSAAEGIVKGDRPGPGARGSRASGPGCRARDDRARHPGRAGGHVHRYGAGQHLRRHLREDRAIRPGHCTRLWSRRGRAGCGSGAGPALQGDAAQQRTPACGGATGRNRSRNGGRADGCRAPGSAERRSQPGGVQRGRPERAAERGHSGRHRRRHSRRWRRCCRAHCPACPAGTCLADSPAGHSGTCGPDQPLRWTPPGARAAGGLARA